MAQQRVLGLLKPWLVKALAFDWDLVDAEHHSELAGSTNLARHRHRLVFVVRQSADAPTIMLIGVFSIGSAAPLVMLGLSWISLSMVWGQGTGIWLMAQTSYRLECPGAVHAAIGPALCKGAGWRINGASAPDIFSTYHSTAAGQPRHATHIAK